MVAGGRLFDFDFDSGFEEGEVEWTGRRAEGWRLDLARWTNDEAECGFLAWRASWANGVTQALHNGRRAEEQLETHDYETQILRTY